MKSTTPAVPGLLAFGLALAAVTALAAPAEAQMAANFMTYGARPAPGTNTNLYFTTWPVSRAECLANTPIQVQLSGAPFNAAGAALSYALWTGGTGETPAACNTAAARTAVSGTSTCTRLTTFSVPVAGVQQVVELPPQTLFGSACDVTSADRAYFLLAVSAPEDFTTDLANTHYVSVRVVADMAVPAAPTVSDAAGDQAVAVTWTLPSGAGTLSSARVFVDTSGSCGGSGDGGVPSSTLVGGATPPTSGYTEVSGASPTTTNLDAEALGLNYGESAAIAVSVLDLARNQSVLSNVACITRVQVVGFWDAYCEDQGFVGPDARQACLDRYNGCSASPGRPRGGMALGLSMLALGLLLSRRARSLRGNS